jgi:dihydroxyacetone kinase-like protein
MEPDMTAFLSTAGGALIKDVAAVIVANKAYLSEIDGKIGDGDHGINMAKGFGRAADKLGVDASFDVALQTLSDVLMNEIGGSMGPLYGLMFADMAEAAEGADTIDLGLFTRMLRAGLEGVAEVGSAKVGDKTLMDTLVPSVITLEDAVQGGVGFATALTAMKASAVTGRDSTVDMVAKIGRSSRLGERSRGVLDAGATSCCLILETLADGITLRLGSD